MSDAFRNLHELDRRMNENGAASLSSLELAVQRSASITAADELADLRARVGELEAAVSEHADHPQGWIEYANAGGGWKSACLGAVKALQAIHDAARAALRGE